MTMRRLTFALLILCLPAAAQTETPERVGVSGQRREISLAGAIEAALRSNLEIEVEKLNIERTTATERGARGFLDPSIHWSPRFEDRATPTSSPLLGREGRLEETVLTQNASFTQRLPWRGISFSAFFDNTRQTTTNPFNSLSPFVLSRLGANFAIPLLRDGETDRLRANLRVTRKQVELSKAAFELKVIDVVRRVEEAYWNLVAARQSVEVSSEAVILAREQLARTKRMIDSGTLAPVELAAAEAELERRLDTWYSAIGVVTQTENQLKQLLAGGRDDGLWHDELLPSEQRTLEPPAVSGVREAVDTALRNRPELSQVDLQMETNGIQQQLARNQTRPQANVIGGVVMTGLAGSITASENPFGASTQLQVGRLNQLSEIAGLPPLPEISFGGVPAGLVGGYGTALEGIFKGSYPTAYIGMEFDLTLRNRAAKAELSRAAIAERQLRFQRSQLEQAIEAQVRNALQEVQTARQRIAAAQASVRAAQEKLDSEIRLFQTGESTNFLVLTRQNELSDSRRRAVVARLDFNKAVSHVNQALGATLRTYNIELE